MSTMLIKLGALLGRTWRARHPCAWPAHTWIAGVPCLGIPTWRSPCPSTGVARFSACSATASAGAGTPVRPGPTTGISSPGPGGRDAVRRRMGRIRSHRARRPPYGDPNRHPPRAPRYASAHHSWGQHDQITLDDPPRRARHRGGRGRGAAGGQRHPCTGDAGPGLRAAGPAGVPALDSTNSVARK
jgi:hypothetical protein